MSDVLDVLLRAHPPADDLTAFVAAQTAPELVTADVTPLWRIRNTRGVFRSATSSARTYTIVPVEQSEHPGTVAVRELGQWLDMPLDNVVKLVGLSPSTRQWWREHPDAPLRPGKAGRLMRLRTAVGLLVGAVGAAEARALLVREHWLDALLDDTRLRVLEAGVRGVLRPSGLTLPAGVADRLASGLTPERLRRLSDPTADLEQQERDRAQHTNAFGPEEPA